jgi:trk system potassium uptake protein TrkA
MRSSILVIGLGRFGATLARELSVLGHEVLAVDKSEVAVNDIAPDVASAVQLDATDERALRSIGAGDFEYAVVAISEASDASIFATLTIKTMGVGHVIAKATSIVHGEILRRVGADRVIYAEHDRAINVAHSLGISSAIEYLTVAPRFGIVKVHPATSWVGQTVGAVDLARKAQVSLVAIRRGPTVTVNPAADQVIEATDELIVMGTDDRLERMAEAH